jgi:MoxR-like ATPase
MVDNEAQREQVTAFIKKIGAMREEIGRVIVGQRGVIDGVLTCLLAGSHALLEGVPGLGKTMIVRTLAQVLGLDFSRIQFTPDLMPADIIGTVADPFFPTSCSPTKSTVQRRRRRARCSKPCRSTA